MTPQQLDGIARRAKRTQIPWRGPMHNRAFVVTYITRHGEEKMLGYNRPGAAVEIAYMLKSSAIYSEIQGDVTVTRGGRLIMSMQP